MGGGGTTTQSTTSSEWPSWATSLGQKLGATGEKFLDQYNTEGTSGLTTAAEGKLSKYLSDDYLNLDNDATVKANEQAITRAGNEAFKTADANIAGGAAQRGGLLSTKTTAAREAAAGKSAQDIADQISKLRSDEQSRRESLQAQSIGTALSQGDADLTKALQLASIVRGTGGSSTSTTQSSPNWLFGLL